MTINREHLAGLKLARREMLEAGYLPGDVPDRIISNLIAQAQAAPEAEPVEVVAVVTTARKKGISEQRSLWHGEDGADQWVAHMQGRGCETSKTLLMTVAQHARIMASAPQHDAELVELLRACVYEFCGITMSRDLPKRIDAKLTTMSAKNEGGKP